MRERPKSAIDRVQTSLEKLQINNVVPVSLVNHKRPTSARPNSARPNSAKTSLWDQKMIRLQKERQSRLKTIQSLSRRLPREETGFISCELEIVTKSIVKEEEKILIHPLYRLRSCLKKIPLREVHKEQEPILEIVKKPIHLK